MTRTVLVTGGAGFVGSHLIERILDVTDWRVVSVDSFQGGGKFFNLVDACGWDRDRVTSVTHDLTIPFSPHATSYVGALGVDAIVNVASRSHVRDSIRDARSFTGNNVQLMLSVLELASNLEVDRFIQMSTDEVYGPYDPQTERDYNPSSPYAASKAAQETFALAWQRTFDVPLTIVNSANMIGERQQETAFLPFVVSEVRAGRIVPVHTHNGLLGIRHYTYVGNVVDELIAELHRETPTGRIQLGGQRTLTNLELVQEVGRVLDITPKWTLVDGSVNRPGYDQHYPDLGSWTDARISFDDGLDRTVRWYIDE